MEDKSIYNKKKTGRKTRQKGFGWYGSLNPNAGDVEKNIEIYNAAQPNGFVATNPVNGNVMGESVEDNSWLEDLRDVLKSALNGKEDTTIKGLKDAYYKNYPWDTEEWGPFSPEDTSWIDATLDAIREYDGMNQFWTDMKDVLYSDLDSKPINEGIYGYQTFIRTGERGKPIYTLTYGQSNGFIVKYDKNDYLLTFGKDWESHISAILEWLREYQPNYFVKKSPDDDGRIIGFTPNEAEAIEYIRSEIGRGLALTEASVTKKYSYTGPIYHLGNKIAEKSRMFTMAKSFAQAANNFRYKAANGDIVGHYDIVDEFVKEVEAPEIISTIEEKPEIIKCDNCGTELNPMGDCPVCDYGEDDLLESIHIDSNLDALSQLNRMEEIV